jgi:signal transduction histidine kinase
VCDGRWPYPVEESAYFLISEAVGNAYKHAAATAITVRVRQVPGRVVIEVADDGIGDAPASGSGNGLTGMRERVAAHGGTLAVEATPGRGTTVRAVLPYGGTAR